MSGTYPPITELVPHAAPMLALEELLDWRDGFARARMTVPAGGPFERDGSVDAVLTLEYMAQTVAACLGMEAFRAGSGVRVGMVVACRRMELARPTLEVGEELFLEARCVRGTDATSHFEGEARDARGELVASATLTLVHGEGPPPG